MKTKTNPDTLKTWSSCAGRDNASASLRLQRRQFPVVFIFINRRSRRRRSRRRRRRRSESEAAEMPPGDRLLSEPSRALSDIQHVRPAAGARRVSAQCRLCPPRTTHRPVRHHPAARRSRVHLHRQNHQVCPPFISIACYLLPTALV